MKTCLKFGEWKWGPYPASKWITLFKKYTVSATLKFSYTIGLGASRGLLQSEVIHKITTKQKFPQQYVTDCDTRTRHCFRALWALSIVVERNEHVLHVHWSYGTDLAESPSSSAGETASVALHSSEYTQTPICGFYAWEKVGYFSIYF